MYLLIPVWENTILLAKNTLLDDPSPDDLTSHDHPKMINLRLNKEESKHRVEEKPYWDLETIQSFIKQARIGTGTSWEKNPMNIWSAGLNPDHCMQYSQRLPLLTSIREPWKILLFAPVEVSNFEVHENTSKLTCFECTFHFIFLLLKF